MKPADVSGMSKELEEVRRIALGEVPADEAQVRAALAQAWAWLAPLTSALLSAEPSSGVSKYTTEDVERWFRAVVARIKGSIETMMARMLRDAALEGSKVPGLEQQRDDALDLLRSARASLRHLGDSQVISEHAYQELATHLDDEPVGDDGDRIVTRAEAQRDEARREVSALTNRATLAEEQRAQTHQQVAEIAKVLDPEVTPDAWGCHEAAQKRMREVSALRAQVAELEREREERAAQHERQMEGARQAVEAVRKLQASAESERDTLRAQVTGLRLWVRATCRGLGIDEPPSLLMQDRALSAPTAETTPDSDGRKTLDEIIADDPVLAAEWVEETTPGPNSPDVPDGSTPPAYRMLSQLDVRPTVPPLLPVSERIQQSLAKLGHEPTPLTTSAADALHPSGRCTCVGEGTCAWCRARCASCGSPAVPEAVRHALAQLWSAVHVTTAYQGLAVAILRAVYPELPVPNARVGADSLLMWNTLAQAVTEAARLGAADMRERAAWTSSNVPLREVEERIRRLSLLPWEEVPRG
ncbi:hypothetical protein HMI51_03305 [Corallococcus coralloides]|nr:hypothetical protein [Corallococcus coralloides]